MAWDLPKAWEDIINGVSDAARGGRANGKDKRKRELVSQTFAEIDEKLLRWIWPQVLPRGKFSIFTGEAGLQKTTAAIDGSARITTGSEWPDGSGRAPDGSVIFISAEDSVADTLRPRAELAGADLHRLHNVDVSRDAHGNVVPFDLQDDLDALERMIVRIGDVVQVVIDPITAYLGAGRIDTHKTSDVRAVLSPLKKFAEDLDVGILGITHPSKMVTKAMNAATGSQAFIAAARASWLFVPEIVDGEETGRRLILPIKNNLVLPSGGLAFRVNDGTTPLGNHAPWLAWESGRVAISADAALALSNELPGVREDRGGMTEAKQFILDEIEAAGGRLEATDIYEAARRAGIAKRTLERAVEKLAVVKEKQGFGKNGKWFWSVPAKAANSP